MLKFMLPVGLMILSISVALPLKADLITLETSFPDRGWYRSFGDHYDNTDNTTTGTLPAGAYRSFYTWDVSALAGLNILDVQLRIGSDLGDGNYPLTINIFDVSHTRDELIATYPAGDPTGLAIFQDLGSGNQYGSFVADSFPDIHQASLTTQAIVDFESSITTGWFAVGLTVVEGDGAIRFDQEPRIQQLLITTVPEPSSTITMCIVGVAICLVRHRLRRSASGRLRSGVNATGILARCDAFNRK